MLLCMLVPPHDQLEEDFTLAVFSGSSSSGGAGVRAVLTAQNWQPLVQVSPGRTTAQVVLREADTRGRYGAELTATTRVTMALQPR